MIRMPSRPAVVLAALALLGLPCSAPAADLVPLNGSFVFNHEPPVPVSSSVVLVKGVFTGQSNLGAFTGQGVIYLNFNTGAYMGTFTWNFPNGSSLSGMVYGQDFPTQTPGVFTTALGAAITGGTGNLQGASGGLLGSGVDNFNQLQVTASFQGLLKLP